MVFSFFGYGANKQEEPAKANSTVRALPASWYTSPAMYRMERRAIFSKRWMLITHGIRLENVGDWLRYDIAGFELVLWRAVDGSVKAFHNMTREDGSKIVTADQGHDEDGGFANDVFPVHVHIDANGFIWVNLERSPTPTIPWASDFEGVDTQPRFQVFDFSQYSFDHVWEAQGEFNWKLSPDNYNECYHCQTTHPDVVAARVDLNVYDVDTAGGHIQHFIGKEREVVSEKFAVASTFYYPNASMTVSANFMFIQRFIPFSATRTVMRYEVFKHRNADEEEFERVDAMFKRVMSEDKWLCIQTQKNLNSGLFVNGELHPRLEKGPIYFQRSVREMVREHIRLEQEVGREVWPAGLSGSA